MLGAARLGVDTDLSEPAGNGFGGWGKSPVGIGQFPSGVRRSEQIHNATDRVLVKWQAKSED